MNIQTSISTSTSTSSLPTHIYYGGDFGLVLNLSELLGASVPVHNVITRLPESIGSKFLTHRALSRWATRILVRRGLFILVSKMENLPVAPRSLYEELEFVGAIGHIVSTDEVALIFRNPGSSWLSKFAANAWVLRIWNTPSEFKDYAELISHLTLKGETILDPFKNELNLDLAQTVNLGRTFISANCASRSTKDLDIQVVTPCSK